MEHLHATLFPLSLPFEKGSSPANIHKSVCKPAAGVLSGFSKTCPHKVVLFNEGDFILITLGLQSLNHPTNANAPHLIGMVSSRAVQLLWTCH